MKKRTPTPPPRTVRPLPALAPVRGGAGYFGLDLDGVGCGIIQQFSGGDSSG